MDAPQAFPTLRRNPLGLGLIAFWLVSLALLAYGLVTLYGHVLARIP